MYQKYNKFDTANMEMAFITANLSYCEKRKVGAVIVKDDRIIANGYNGTISGDANICEDFTITCNKCNTTHIFKNKPLNKIVYEDAFIKHTEPDKESLEYYKHKTDKGYFVKECQCGTTIKFTKEHLDLKSNINVIHAEQNAILFAARHGISIKDATMFVTTAPCIECAKFIAGSGIKKVIWKDVYKNFDGVDYLQENGIECYKYDFIRR